MIDIAPTGMARIQKRRRPPLSQTPFDPRCSDESYWNRDEAIGEAMKRAPYRGRQQVRTDVAPVSGVLFWLVQDIR